MTPDVLHAPGSLHRFYVAGVLDHEDGACGGVHEHLRDPRGVVWMHLQGTDAEQLTGLAEQFDLAPLAVEDVLQVHQRPKVDRHDGHLFLSLYGTAVDPSTSALAASELAVLVGDRWVITVVKTGVFDVDVVRAAWDRTPELADEGVVFLLHGLLKVVVDGHFAALQALDEAVEALEVDLFSEAPGGLDVQRRTFVIRKALVELRRVALPMPEVLQALSRGDRPAVSARMQPFFADTHDDGLRVAQWSDSLRELLGSIQDSSLQLQSNRTNDVMRRLSAGAAVFGASTAITGFYGMNVLFPQVQTRAGALTATLVLAGACVGLLAYFRWRRWL